MDGSVRDGKTLDFWDMSYDLIDRGKNIFLNTLWNRNKPKGYFPLKRHTREGLVVSILRGKLPGCSKYIYIFHWRTI